MSNSVTISVPARLHLGFLDPGGGERRRFGSLGLPLSEPETVVNLTRAGETVVIGPQGDRAARHLESLRRRLGIRAQHRLVIERAIPSHAGLGSGTQIALAVAAAVRTLHGLPLDTEGDAILLGRGGRSGIGIASFSEGGVIIDAGSTDRGKAPPVIARLPIPEEWRVILIFDRAADGLHGDSEIEAFSSLPPFPATGVGEICRRVLMGVMPALIGRDLAGFGAAVTDIQMLVGAHFAPAQGGVFMSKRVEDVARRLAAVGAVGIGQSSWGPTGFAFAASQAEAAAMVASVGESDGAGLEIKIAQGRNSGARIASAGLGLVGS
ncbi:beta-ribofuranosylaminobenzene 5'-phosphate synthase family protein [Arvimicrobium flavum]|uniref:beta-ribofuranosylaminobenzene 5'-phosphate synthase family protein n=1 Tax=Arvimicrobium flavum TaxID=3393320 RepID=UPI00237C18E7|nr:beta-ribofuranosylaminobenzene 5'-phosphate synthase family protein [Mesorhizobium shangrilense]